MSFSLKENKQIHAAQSEQTMVASKDLVMSSAVRSEDCQAAHAEVTALDSALQSALVSQSLLEKVGPALVNLGVETMHDLVEGIREDIITRDVLVAHGAKTLPASKLLRYFGMLMLFFFV